MTKAINECYDTITVLNDFDTGMVTLSVDQYKRLPAAFLDIYRLFRRLKHAQHKSEG